ncbi:hypothetical protein DFH27DRAFT_222679 [Peziza echinospora]|nr:hypothetical protein DFH27DRAFT_222679 [Peziza echinospora]
MRFLQASSIVPAILLPLSFFSSNSALATPTGGAGGSIIAPGSPSLSQLIAIKAKVIEYKLRNRHASGVDCACAVLQKLEDKADVLEKSSNSTQYLEEANRHFSQTDYKKPSCIFLPVEAADVARAVAVLDTCGAVFAVRGGGHMTPPGFSNIDDGVLISLSKLKQLELNPAVEGKTRTVDVGPGNRWRDVSRYLQPHNLVAVGGRVATVGVPGVVLGGGISYHTSKFGFSMDNVEEYEVVLADARIVTATPNNVYKDLYWALRGGSSNFGIVTRFKLLAHATPAKVWISQSFVPIGPDASGQRPVLAKFLDQLQTYVETQDRNSAVLPVFMNVPSAGGDVINLALTTEDVDQSAPYGSGFVLKDPTTTPPTIGPDLTLVPKIFKNIVEEMPVLQGLWNVTVQGDLADLIAAGTPDGYSHSWRVHSAIATRESSDIITKILYQRTPLLLSEVFKDAPQNYGAASLAIQTITSSALKYGESRYGGNTFGIDSSKSYFWYILTTSWGGAQFDAPVNAWAEETLRLIDAELTKKKLSHPFIYLNDASKEQEGTGGKVIERYGKEELKKLKKIRNVFDPKRLWKKGLVGGYKVPE